MQTQSTQVQVLGYEVAPNWAMISLFTIVVLGLIMLFVLAFQKPRRRG
jgi:hypothetical protein